MGKRVLIFLVHQEELAHWCLAAADVTNKQITHFDSLKNENLKCLRILKNFLQEVCGQTYSTIQEKNIPIQTNSYDCGSLSVCMPGVKQKNQVSILANRTLQQSEGTLY